MQTMPAFLWNERAVFVSHRASLTAQRRMSMLRSIRSAGHPEPRSDGEGPRTGCLITKLRLCKACTLCEVLRFAQDDIAISAQAFAALADGRCSILRRPARR